MRSEAHVFIALWHQEPWHRPAGVNVNAVYAAHTGSWEADTAVNIVGADRGVMGF